MNLGRHERVQFDLDEIRSRFDPHVRDPRILAEAIASLGSQRVAPKHGALDRLPPRLAR